MTDPRPLPTGAVVVRLTILIGGLALGLACVLAGVILFTGERTIYQRATSPDGWREARVQFDDAGAVDGFSRLVFVKSRLNPSDEPLLSCRAFWADGEADVRLRWMNAHTLLIQHAFAPNTVQAVAPACGAVQIIVRPMSAPRVH